MTRSPLHNLQQRSGATFGQLFGWQVATTFGDVVSEYRAATQGVALLDRSFLGRFRATGKDVLDLMNRLSSNKVDDLFPGTGAGTVLPTPKGKVIDLLYLFERGDHVLVITSWQTRRRVAEWVELYTFLEEATLNDVTEETAMLTVLGPRATELVGQATGTPAKDLPPYGSAAVWVNNVPAVLLRTDPLGNPGYDLVTSADQGEALWEALASQAPGVTPIGEDVFNTLRVEAGLPRYGWELSEEQNPWEANLHPFIHFGKGCYTGQEVILRLHHYQKVQRRLVTVTFSSSEVSEGNTLSQGDKEAGRVTSVVQHPVTGKAIGLAIVRNTFSKPGTELEVVDGQSHLVTTATVRELPAGAAMSP